MRVVYAGGSQVASLITTLNPTVTSPQVGYIYSITGTLQPATRETVGTPVQPPSRTCVMWSLTIAVTCT